MKFSVGMLLSYDYELLKISIPIIYPYIDEIVLSKDSENKTWNNSSFEINSDFFSWIEKFDVKNKIKFHTDSFFNSELSTIQNECKQRTLLADSFENKIWYIQIDPDEYFLDFNGFLDFLRKQNSKSIINKREKIQVACFLSILYKKDKEGYFYVSKPFERALVATNYPVYKNARMNGTQIFYTNCVALHQTWARSREEILYKINNWGHNNDFDTEHYIMFWDSVNKTNYKTIENFHPVEKKKWKTLDYCNGLTIEDVKNELLKRNSLKISKSYVFFKNLGQCIKHFNFKPLIRHYFN